MPLDSAHYQENAHTEPYLCPRCQKLSLSRMHRTTIDRLISLVVPVKRFECEACSWVGIIRSSKRLQSTREQR
jgi:predicted RNA-binding Zn-ribbon protein involved in translation (DUF1610 family)